ncbi:MAG: hypothetical protein AAB819_01835 [Patescibacteria group bacterium]
MHIHARTSSAGIALIIFGLVCALYIAIGFSSSLAAQTTQTIGETPFCYDFPRNLKVGMSGFDVKNLQILLNTDPRTRIALSGIGSLGNETKYFGTLTKEAVINFQEAYANEILVPSGLFVGNGYVGPVTRKVLERLYSCDNDLRSVPLSILAPTGATASAFPEEAPTIVSVQPLSVIVGQEVTLNGAGFSTTSNKVLLNNIIASPLHNLSSFNNGTVIRFNVPNQIFPPVSCTGGLCPTTFPPPIPVNPGAYTVSVVNSKGKITNSMPLVVLSGTSATTEAAEAEVPPAPLAIMKIRAFVDNDTATNVSAAPVGAQIQIIGSGFVETGATVVFNGKGEKLVSTSTPVVHLGVNADVISDTEIRVHVPGYMYTKAKCPAIGKWCFESKVITPLDVYEIYVETESGATSNKTALEIVRPKITEFIPTTAKSGDRIVIKGWGFSQNGNTFYEVSGTGAAPSVLGTLFNVAADDETGTSLTVTIPDMLPKTYQGFIQNVFGYITNNFFFTVRPVYASDPVVLRAIIPNSGREGDPLIVEGSGFTPNGNTILYNGGGPSQYLPSTNTGGILSALSNLPSNGGRIYIRLPKSITPTTYTISVRNGFGNVSNQLPFKVVPLSVTTSSGSGGGTGGSVASFAE